MTPKRFVGLHNHTTFSPMDPVEVYKSGASIRDVKKFFPELSSKRIKSLLLEVGILRTPLEALEVRKPAQFDRVKSCAHCGEPFDQSFARHVFCKKCAPTGKFSKYIRKYGIGHREWISMLTRQNGCCAICQTKLDLGKNTHVDHDHVTKRVRGLLCNPCNTRVGVLDNESFMTPAMMYLAECSSTPSSDTMEST